MITQIICQSFLQQQRLNYSISSTRSVHSKRMSESESYCISGPANDYPIPNESMGKFLYESLQRRGVNDIVNVDAVSGKVLTCGKLLEDSIKATDVLKNLGVKKGDVVGIISENTINYCVPVLGALYIGATVNLLNPGYAIGELEHTLKISKPKLIFCSELTLGNILKVKEELKFIETIVLMGPRCENHKIVSFENLLETIKVDVENFEPETFDCSEQGAFVLLSSGTTGLPKGVFLTHQNLQAPMNYLHDQKYGGITSEETTLLVLPFFHIFGLFIQISAIAFSMKLVLLEKFKPDAFLRSIQEYKVTKLFIVPPLLLFLARSPLVDNYDMSSVRDILVGAAPVGRELQADARKRFSGVALRQLYGATEVCGACTFQPFGVGKPGSAGTLVPGMTAMVWDIQLNKKMGPLKTGELCFKGSMIMKGYFGNTAATEECIDKEEFYHTGDLGYYDQDGDFYIVDRIKELIKYKGFQVAPAELEALILTHPEVKDCGVVGIPDEKAGEVPLAYIVRENGSNVTQQTIVDYVAARISVQKHLYGGVVFVEEIPKNPSGKILRRKLREIFKNSCKKVVNQNGVSK